MTALPIGDGEASTLLAPLAAYGRIVLAVSGGSDSMALMHLAGRSGLDPRSLIIATVDHRLRPGSEAEAGFVVRAAERLGLAARRLVWSAASPGPGLQQRARAARWSLLTALAREEGANAIVTAHTADDQAETVLMRLAHGSGVDGLGGMRALSRRDGIDVLRPLLTVTKERLIATLRALGEVWIDDPSNADPRFERVRLRRLIAANGLDAARLATVARRAGEAADALDEIAAARFREVAERRGALVMLDAAVLREPVEIARRVVALALGVEAPLDALERAVDRLRAGDRVRLSLAGHVIDRRGDGIAVRPEEGRRRNARAAAGRPSPDT